MSAGHIADHPQLQTILASREKIVYLCGAGFSMSLGGHRNSWGNWLTVGRAYLSAPERAGFDAAMGSRSANELIRAASYLLRALKADGAYRTFMDRTIGALRPTARELIAVLQKIGRAGDLIATTNYDLLIERAMGLGSVAYDAPGEILSVIKGTGANRVIHLHGLYDGSSGTDTIIADTAQYREILENAGAQFIQELLGTHPILIVGCGETVSDPNLSGFLKFVFDKLDLDIPYFYLMREGETPPELPANALPVCYGSTYADLPAFLDELSSYRLRTRADTRALVEIDPYAQPERLCSGLGRMHFSNRFSPFIGREEEKARLDAFLDGGADRARFRWWTVLGEGGAGKSRLVLEWLQGLPANWYGFFARKSPDACARFVPFTDTVVAFDYILGEEDACARSILALIEQFRASPYRLRLLLIERQQRDEEEDWLAKLCGTFCTEDRLAFERARCLGGARSADEAVPLTVGPLCAEEELHYIRAYLSAYATAFLDRGTAKRYLDNIDRVSREIFDAYRASLDQIDRRPLYLSVFTEVWADRDGPLELHGAKQLLKAYLEKEIGRWRTLLHADKELLHVYLRLLAMACTIGSFNITDVLGDNYLRDDCVRMSAFLDGQDKLLGPQGLLDALFVQTDTLETVGPDDADEETVFTRALQNEELPADERFPFAAPYLKLFADPEIFYLTLLKNAGALSEEELAELERLKKERALAEAALPDTAWIIEPVLPDIIKSFLVLHVVKDRDMVRFTRLARSNSVYGISQFLTRALVDWPEEAAFQTMLVTPPDEVLEHFEFYVPLLTQARSVADFRPVEKILLETEATLPFAQFEMELWRRIAIVLTERDDRERLLDSGMQFIRYVKADPSHPKIRSAVVGVMQAYCVGLYNGEEMEMLGALLSQCDTVADLLEGDPAVARFCCEQRGMLLHLRRYLKKPEQIGADWDIIAGYLARLPDDRELCLTAMGAADEYLLCCREAGRLERVRDLTATLERAYQRHHVVEVAQLLALSTANQYVMTYDRTGSFPSALFEACAGYWRDFPDVRQVRSAYASVCGYEYAKDFRCPSDVPQYLMRRLRKWSEQYPDEVEFQEAYFNLLLAHLGYVRHSGTHKEKRRTLREMETVARRANYEAYGEENKLLRVTRQMRAIERL